MDVWSLGCVLYAMLAGRCPFRGANNCETRSNILENKFTMNYICSRASFEARDLIVRMLEPCPEKRLTINQALPSSSFLTLILATLGLGTPLARAVASGGTRLRRIEGLFVAAAVSATTTTTNLSTNPTANNSRDSKKGQ